MDRRLQAASFGERSVGARHPRNPLRPAAVDRHQSIPAADRDAREQETRMTLRPALPRLLIVLLAMGCAPMRDAPSRFTSDSGRFSARVDEHGTLTLGERSIPFPETASPEARALYVRIMRDAIARAAPDAPSPFASLEAAIAGGQQRLRVRNEIALVRHGATAEEQMLGGVRTIRVTPRVVESREPARVLVNLHGGAFLFYSGSVVEAVPVATFAQIPVVAIDYRMPPAHPFPAALDDVVAVYRALLEHHRPEDIGFYGTSAGANLTAATVLRLDQEGLPRPGAIAVISYGGGDSLATNDGLDPYLSTFGGSDSGLDPIALYAAGHDVEDPLITPLKGDFRGAPPALLVTGTRDLFLSGTTRLHLRMLQQGVDARLVVFDAMWHGFDADVNVDEEIPEAVEASRLIARFFREQLGRTD